MIIQSNISYNSQMTYNCEVCANSFDQKSKFTLHMKNKHPKKESKSKESKTKESKTKEPKNVKIAKEKKEVKKKTKESKDAKTNEKKKELVLQKPDGTKIWERSTENELKNEDIETLKKLKDAFDTLIKQCHQILYNNGAIVGKKAMDDIMKILTLKLLQPLFDPGMILHTKYIEEMNKPESDEERKEDMTRAYHMCVDLSKIYRAGDSLDKWRDLIKHLLPLIMSGLYGEKDINFNGDERAIKNIMKTIDGCYVFGELMKEKDGKKYYDTVSGEIYEYFMNKYVSGKGQRLGQFFTPRPMIDMMVYGLKLTEHLTLTGNTSIYDPCTGSGGFLTRLYNCFPTIKPINIYGGEYEKDTMKFCVSNLLLTTNTFCENIVNRHSIVYEDDVKHDIILTNPPFGTSMQYGRHMVKEDGKNVQKDGLEQEYDEDQKKRNGSVEVKFKTIYPIETNDGACLFTQKCVHKLKDGGVLQIVLPDGQLFFGKNFMKFRKWLSEKMNIRAVVQAPSGTFDYAGVKTCIIMATKDGPTQRIQFLKTNNQCSYLERIVAIDSDDLTLANYSLDPKDYLEDAYLSKMMDGSTVEWVPLEEICEIRTGEYITKKTIKSGEYPVYGGGDSRYSINKFNRENKLVIAKDGVSENCVRYVNSKFFLNHHGWTLEIKTNKINEKYINHYLTNNQKYIFDMACGSSQKGINQSQINSFKIPLPSLSIQQKIVVELDQLEEHTRTLKQLMEHTKKAKEMYSSYGLIGEIRALLKGCEWKALGDVCEFQNGTQLDKKNIKPGDYPVFGGGMKHVGYHNSYNRNGNEVIVCGTGAAGYVNRYNGKYWASQCFTMKSIEAYIDQDYLYYFTKMTLEKYFESQTRGTAQPYIRFSQFVNYKIPLPSLSIQQQCIEVYQKKESRLKEYDEEMERIGNQIKQCQEMGRQVIEYHITADAHPYDESVDDRQDTADDEDEPEVDAVDQEDGMKRKKEPNKEIVQEDEEDEQEDRMKRKKEPKKEIVQEDEEDEQEDRMKRKVLIRNDVRKIAKNEPSKTVICEDPDNRSIKKDATKTVRKSAVVVKKKEDLVDSKPPIKKRIVRKNLE